MSVIVGTLWTDEMIATLRSKKAEGKASREIAKEMGLSRDAVNKAWGRYRIVAAPEVASSGLTLADFAKHYDTRQAILDAVNALQPGDLRYQAEICQIASPHDRARFNRCVESHDEEFSKYRLKARMSNWPEARWVWGLPKTIDELRAWQEKV